MRGDSRPPLSGAARLLRVTTLAGASLALALSAHVVGGGAMPSPGGLSLIGTAALAVALLLTRRRCRLWVLAATVVAEQTLMHLALPVSGAVICMPATTGMSLGHRLLGGGAACGSGPAGIGGVLPPAASGVPSTVGMSMPGMSMPAMPDLPMLLAHGVATVVVVLLLWRGETWLWRVVARLLGLPGTGPASLGVRAALWARSVRLRPRSPRRPAAPRGPPLRLALT